jgi:hypothetical protein
MIKRILDNAVAETRWRNSLNAKATMPDILSRFPLLIEQQLSSRNVMMQEIVCHEYRNDHDGVIARSSRQQLQELTSYVSSLRAFEDHLASTYAGGRFYPVLVDGDCTMHSMAVVVSVLEKHNPLEREPGDLRSILADFLEGLSAEVKLRYCIGEIIPALRRNGSFQGFSFQPVYMAFALVYSMSFLVMSQSTGPSYNYMVTEYSQFMSAQKFEVELTLNPQQSLPYEFCFAQSEVRQHTDIFISLKPGKT